MVFETPSWLVMNPVKNTAVSYGVLLLLFVFFGQGPHFPDLWVMNTPDAGDENLLGSLWLAFIHLWEWILCVLHDYNPLAEQWPVILSLESETYPDWQVCGLLWIYQMDTMYRPKFGEHWFKRMSSKEEERRRTGNTWGQLSLPALPTRPSWACYSDQAQPKCTDIP